MILGVAISAGSILLPISSDAVQSFFVQLEQIFTLDDIAKGVLDNDALD